MDPSFPGEHLSRCVASPQYVQYLDCDETVSATRALRIADLACA